MCLCDIVDTIAEIHIGRFWVTVLRCSGYGEMMAALQFGDSRKKVREGAYRYRLLRTTIPSSRLEPCYLEKQPRSDSWIGSPSCPERKAR